MGVFWVYRTYIIKTNTHANTSIAPRVVAKKEIPKKSPLQMDQFFSGFSKAFIQTHTHTPTYVYPIGCIVIEIINTFEMTIDFFCVCAGFMFNSGEKELLFYEIHVQCDWKSFQHKLNEFFAVQKYQGETVEHFGNIENMPSAVNEVVFLFKSTRNTVSIFYVGKSQIFPWKFRSQLRRQFSWIHSTRSMWHLVEIPERRNLASKYSEWAKLVTSLQIFQFNFWIKSTVN